MTTTRRYLNGMARVATVFTLSAIVIVSLSAWKVQYQGYVRE